MLSQRREVTKREKYSILIIISIIAFTFLVYNLFTPLYYHFTMGASFPLNNLYNQNWSHSLGADLFALTGMALYIGIATFVFLVTNSTTTPAYPGIFFFFATWISIPIMIKFTSGISKWRRMLYIYLVATQLSSMIIVYWTSFGG